MDSQRALYPRIMDHSFIIAFVVLDLRKEIGKDDEKDEQSEYEPGYFGNHVYN
jgi:hypothetical protein